MSRCFPFPPPGYIKNAIRDEPLNELIELETKEAKRDRKKEKKREKKEKRKANENGDVENKQHKHKRKHKEEKSQKDEADLAYEKKQRQNELDCLEKSSLTEEQGQAVGSQNSTNSTLNSNKRQKLLTSPPDVSQSSGSIIRIKLSIQRQKDPEVLPDGPSSSLGRTPDTSIRGNVGPEAIKHNTNKPLTLPSADVSKIPTLKSGAEPPSNLCSHCPPEFSLQYKNVFENWVPPPLELNDTELDQSWLFETMKKHDKKACDSSTNVDAYAHSSGLYPRAICLPGADIYALPFVLPY